jgi:hypothetical protein
VIKIDQNQHFVHGKGIFYHFDKATQWRSFIVSDCGLWAVDVPARLSLVLLLCSMARISDAKNGAISHRTEMPLLMVRLQKTVP